MGCSMRVISITIQSRRFRGRVGGEVDWDVGNELMEFVG